jgi:glutamate formiminotransferase
MPVEDRDWNNANLSIRLKDAEATRYWRIMDAAKKRNPYINKTVVMRELLGLDPPNALTAAEIAHFQDPQLIGRPLAKNSKVKVPLLNRPKEEPRRKTG